MGAIKDLDYLENEISLSLYCRALAHPARVKILTELYQNPKGTRNLDLTFKLRMSKNAVKNHVEMMKDAGIIKLHYHTHYYQIKLNSKGVCFAEKLLSDTN